jgi:DNA replication licensing factor MCM3
VVIANNITSLSKEATMAVSREDVRRCKRLARKGSDVVETLSHSVAPSIQGHDMVKKAILCMLLGGAEKVLENGTRLRG